MKNNNKKLPPQLYAWMFKNQDELSFAGNLKEIEKDARDEITGADEDDEIIIYKLVPVSKFKMGIEQIPL